MQQNVENTTTTLVVKITICHNKSKRFSWFAKNACLVQGFNQIITQLLGLDDESICVKTDRYSKTDRQIVLRFVSQAIQIIRLEGVLMCSINDSKQFDQLNFISSKFISIIGIQNQVFRHKGHSLRHNQRNYLAQIIMQTRFVMNAAI